MGSPSSVGDGEGWEGPGVQDWGRGGAGVCCSLAFPRIRTRMGLCFEGNFRKQDRDTGLEGAGQEGWVPGQRCLGWGLY